VWPIGVLNQPARELDFLLRLFRFSGAPQRQAQLIVRFAVVRLEPDRLAQVEDRLVDNALLSFARPSE
jgi:hypothetical protein